MQDLMSFSLSKITTRLCQYGLFILSGVAAMTGLQLATAEPAAAQAAYGSYVGIGPAFGVTSGSSGEESKTTANIAVRYKFLRAPISLRTQVLVGDDGTAIVPTVSYDIPLNWQADVYVGAGAVIVPGDGLTPVGNKTSFAIQPGIDYALPNSGFVVFGNAIIAFDAYEKAGSTAVSVQGGVGLRF
jgi:hypothetical protein